MKLNPDELEKLRNEPVGTESFHAKQRLLDHIDALQAELDVAQEDPFIRFLNILRIDRQKADGIV